MTFTLKLISGTHLKTIYDCTKLSISSLHLIALSVLFICTSCHRCHHDKHKS